MTESKGVSMLDKLAGKIVETKTVAGAKLAPALTPVAGEVFVQVGIPNHPLGSLAEDPDIILGRLAVARREVESILESILKLEGMYGKPETIIAADAVQSEALIQKERERRADDAAKAREGDKAAAKRVETASPIEAVVEAEDARLRKRAAVIAAMAGETPGGPDVAEPFDERMARLQAEAQAQVFSPVVAAAQAAAEVGGGPAEVMKAAMAAAEGPADGLWSCPKHGNSSIIVKTSPRRGVSFRKCAADDCHEFEKV